MDYKKIMDMRNETNAFAKYLNMKTIEMAEGYAKTEMIVNQELLNPQGSIHGGAIYTLADLAGGSAASSRGYYIATLNADFHYLRAGLNVKKMTAEATEIKYGKRAMVYRITVKDQDDVILGDGTFTFMAIGKMEGIEH